MQNSNVFSPFQRYLFIAGILILFIPKLINSYFLMPFPGSMDAETMAFSYQLDKVADFFLFTGGPIVVWGCFILFANGSMAKKAGALFLIIASAAFYYYSLYEFNAKEMFREPSKISFKKASLDDYNSNAYVLGVTDKNVSKAYPLKFLAYHHKVHDNINGQDILVTYCSMCRSGRVFSPYVEGAKVTFRLVGARHYNAVIEDSKTKTWWYQATGVAAAGPLKGEKLKEIPSEQTTWRAWKESHPNTLLLQPDPAYVDVYNEWFETFDGMRSPPDSIPENKKTWVIGITYDDKASAYPIPVLVRQKIINDESGNTPFMVSIEKDSLTTHVFSRRLENKVLTFEMDSTWTFMNDKETASRWNLNGLGLEGFYAGKQLNPKQHYNEYLRSWEQFHPNTRIWK